MWLERLRLSDFRSIAEADLKLSAGVNWIYGDNAAGKTSVLEALFVLGRGRSFRAQHLRQLTRDQAQQWRVLVDIATDAGDQHRLGVGLNDGNREARVDGSAVSSYTTVLRLAPILFFDPHGHQLIEEGPAFRRAFVDWGVFHVEPRFAEWWRVYRRLLMQRNSALRTGCGDDVVKSWDRELERISELLTAAREQHVADVAEQLALVFNTLTDLQLDQLRLQRGWSQAGGLAEQLASGLDGQRRLGQTPIGPHRAELKLSLNHGAMKLGLSRGQQKLVVLALQLAQAQAVRVHTGEYPVLLVDDVAAELSKQSFGRLMNQLESYPGQCLLTGFDAMKTNHPRSTTFHVEHGRIRQHS